MLAAARAAWAEKPLNKSLVLIRVRAPHYLGATPAMGIATGARIRAKCKATEASFGGFALWARALGRPAASLDPLQGASAWAGPTA